MWCPWTDCAKPISNVGGTKDALLRRTRYLAVPLPIIILYNNLGLPLWMPGKCWCIVSREEITANDPYRGVKVNDRQQPNQGARTVLNLIRDTLTLPVLLRLRYLIAALLAPEASIIDSVVKCFSEGHLRAANSFHRCLPGTNIGPEVQNGTSGTKKAIWSEHIFAMSGFAPLCSG